MEKLTAQETLIAYCSTLSEKKCKEAYQILLERFEVHRARCLTFNREGKEDKPPEGKVRLTPNQFQLVLDEYGEQGFHRLCELMYDYICNLEERAPFEVIAVRKLKNYRTISHYYKLTKGWVAEKFSKEQPEVVTSFNKEPLQFHEVSTKAQALEYIKSIPRYLRFNNQEIIFLINQYSIKDCEVN